MQDKNITNQILEYIPTIDYSNTSTEVSLFETTVSKVRLMFFAPS